MTMTYNSLVAQVMDYLNRTDADTLAEVANFIYQAEQRICRESKNIGLEVYVTGNFTPNVAVMAKPARWRRNISFNYGNGAGSNVFNPITLRTYEFIRNYWPNQSLTSPPMFYADYGYSNLVIAPTPDLSYPFEYVYLELPIPIGPALQTNWLTNYAPDVLLYATLLEAVSFLQNDERIPTWEKYYQKGIDSLNSQDDQRVLDRQSNRASD